MNYVDTYLQEELGYRGQVLRNLKSFVRTEKDVRDFQAFIIRNDGKWRSNLELAHVYMLYVQKESDYDKHLFVTDYRNGYEKEALTFVMKSDVHSITLKKVQELLTYGLTLEELYDKLIEYRGSHDALSSVELIELHMYI